MSKSVYEMVTEKIISQLESGVIPWEKPWTGAYNEAYNRISKKSYSFINQMLLLHNGEYATFKQWESLGGRIKKGEKSEIVVFWKPLPIEVQKEDGTKEIKQVPFLRYYNVFHISQVKGVEVLENERIKNINPIEEAEKILDAYINRENIKLIKELSNDAYYSPGRDLIHLPLIEQFNNVNEYYSTFFHEITHSTGHEKRLNRMEPGVKVAKFGNTEYSKEELVAEIGAANILNILGIETIKTFRNSTAYIQSWLQVLKNDAKFIVSASSKAEKAVKYILGENKNETMI